MSYSVGNKYPLKNGKLATILATNPYDQAYPLIGVVEGSHMVHSWSAKGEYTVGYGREYDLLPADGTVWLVLENGGDGKWFEKHADAAAYAAKVTHFAVVPVDLSTANKV